MAVGVTQNRGVAALARETGYSIATVSQKLKLGRTPDSIRQQAKLSGKSAASTAARRAGSGSGSGAPGQQEFYSTNGHKLGTGNGNGGQPSQPPAPPSAMTVVPTPVRLETYPEALARKERAMADKVEIEIAQRSNELVPIGQINAWFAGVIIKARDVLTNLGPELADRLAQETDPVMCEQMVTAEVNRALSALAVFGQRSGAHAV